ERCEAWLDIHMPPGAPIGEITSELEESVERERKGHSSVETTLRIATIDAGYTLPEKGPFVAALKSAYGKSNLAWKPASFVSHSDANQLWRAGVKPVLIGPGSLEKAHAPDESIPFKEVIAAARLFAELLLCVGSA
ncbi:MAG: M20/M25/M40 family metallo-hydrolase, partial [Deltaproteobacteria bacterium]|nr:M20/M25/M40 family metallo-hydrolase [Deltaproteobacteria bacterium]